ncbi:MAG: hypothetical protein K9I94_06010 [Bacteroidales bacterium]|nr:hypothetical protein [Bacteroidales bacterium]
MKKIGNYRAIIIMALFLVNSSIAYSQVDQVKYERLDQIKKKYSSIFSNKSASIEFNHVEISNLDNGEIIKGVEVFVYSSKTEIVGSSLAFANLGNIWGSSVGVTTNNINKEGYIFLTANNLQQIQGFINKAIAATGQQQDNYILYKLTLNEKLELGMYYDPESNEMDLPQNEKWKFYVTINTATYTGDYDEGIELLRKLNSYRKAILKL